MVTPVEGRSSVSRGAVIHYVPGPSIEEVRSGVRSLALGDTGPAVRELQRMLNASGASPPLVEDGFFGPKTEAALSRFMSPADGTGAGRPDHVPPLAPMHDAPMPPGTVTAGELARRDEAARRPPFHPSGMTSGAPPGYRPITGPVPPAVVAKAKSLLGGDFGTETPFEIDGKRYLARVEHHYHPPGYVGGPNGWHKGVTVYEAKQ